MPESRFAEQLARHVQEGEERAVRLKGWIADMKTDGRSDDARRATALLGLIVQRLKLSRSLLRQSRCSS